MVTFFRKYFFGVALVVVFLIGLYFRLYGLRQNYSFWVDEASTARFGRAVLETKIPKIQITGYLDRSYYVTHYLTGYLFKIFGVSEFAARLPEVIFGSLVILATYLLGKELFGKQVGFASSLFIAFSYIQIAWSRQARGYVILEFFFLLTLLFLYRFTKYIKTKDFLLFLFFLILSCLTHSLGLILFPISFIFLVQKKRRSLFLFPLILFLLVFPIREPLALYFSELFGRLLKGENFVSYYHSLFWRQYPIFVFLSFVGFLVLLLNGRKKEFFFLSISLFCYVFMVCFLAVVPFEKYVFPVFPLVFIISSFSLKQISEILFKSRKNFLFFVLVGFILVNGNKFTLKPRAFYSLNFDMKEIPEIDYKGIYQVVKEKTTDINKQDLAVVEIDADAPAWYLGEGINGFVPRNDIPGPVDISRGYRQIHSLDEFKKVQREHRYGFVNLIEHNFRFYPEGLVEYVRSNLKLEKKEQYASFSPDWNHWPVELYSWGFSGSGLNK